MQSTHLPHLSAAALQCNHRHASHLWSCSYIQPSDRQTVPGSLPGIIVKRTITALCVPATASADSPEDLDQSAIRLQSVGLFHINCLDHILFWILSLIPRLRSDSWKLTVGYLCADPALLNTPFNLFT
ncbi:hypothetical protein GOODEAATRI_033640 [Goodea atripinnis]|uniref:Uncharacterized protein n=1 Tax=Goodea atripinnis TaxID=208336 RepID=A0ABV0P077_9TELE